MGWADCVPQSDFRCDLVLRDIEQLVSESKETNALSNSLARFCY
jgi:hypothetical protein